MGNDVDGMVKGSDFIESLPAETRKGVEEISFIPQEDWLRYYRRMKEKDSKRARLNTHSY